MPSAIILALTMLIVSSLMGYFSSEPETIRRVMEDLDKAFDPLKKLNPIALVVFIFLNNSVKALLAIFTGLLLGLGPVIFLVGNGIILGIVIRAISVQHGMGLTLLSLLPHGILEIPAMIISAALGFHLGISVLYMLMRKNAQIKAKLMSSLVLFMVAILPVLALAAVIEVFITPLFAKGI